MHSFFSEWHNDSPTVLVHTSGSTGSPKPLLVEKRRMETSARHTIAALGLQPGDSALLCMPLDFIAGKMMVVRAIVGNLRLISVEPSSHPLRGLKEIPDFAAMVPMQVYNSMQSPDELAILKKIPHIIIGGGAIDESLERELSSFTNDIRSTYGMTETLSHIALRQISGERTEWYTPLPNVSVSLSPDGCLIIDAPDVCSERLTTNDLAELHPDGHRFRILGRRDNVICSGGIKIQIEEVERMLRPHISQPFIITRRPDPQLGEAVVMLCEGQTDINAIDALCNEVLPRYFRPRNIISVDALPMTATGKPARKEAEHLAMAFLKKS